MKTPSSLRGLWEEDGDFLIGPLLGLVAGVVLLALGWV